MTENKISFENIIKALLDESTPFSPRYLNQFSDLDGRELSLLESSWPQVSLRRRQALLDDIEELGETDFVLSFESVARMALKDVDPTVRATAVRVLWEYEEPTLIPLYFDLIASDPDANVRAAVATALGRYIYLGEIQELDENDWHAVEDVLLGVLKGTGAVLVRRRALESLGHSSREEVPPLIEDAYASGDKDWLASALFAMGRSTHEHWGKYVVDMLAHPYSAVRMEAARAVGELQLHDTLDTLIELLQDDDDNVRAAAIWSLSELGGDGVSEALEMLQEETEDDEEVEYIQAALDNLAFNEDLELFTLFDLPESQNGSGEDDDDDELFELFDQELEDDDDKDLSG